MLNPQIYETYQEFFFLQMLAQAVLYVSRFLKKKKYNNNNEVWNDKNHKHANETQQTFCKRMSKLPSFFNFFSFEMTKYQPSEISDMDRCFMTAITWASWWWSWNVLEIYIM